MDLQLILNTLKRHIHQMSRSFGFKSTTMQTHKINQFANSSSIKIRSTVGILLEATLSQKVKEENLWFMMTTLFFSRQVFCLIMEHPHPIMTRISICTLQIQIKLLSITLDFWSQVQEIYLIIKTQLGLIITITILLALSTS